MYIYIYATIQVVIFANGTRVPSWTLPNTEQHGAGKLSEAERVAIIGTPIDTDTCVVCIQDGAPKIAKLPKKSG